MISGRPDIFPTAAMSLRSTETSSEALQLCQKQRREACAVCHKHPHEAFAVCHKHPQAARACQKRPVLAKGHLLSQSSILCASCRCRAYASACMCAAQQGTRHNAWAWQLISPAMRPKLLNSSFLYVRGVLNQVLSQFLPHGKHVLACLYRFASYCRRTACVDSVFVCVPDVFDRSSAATWRLLPHFGTGRHGKRMQVQRRKKTPRGETAKAVPRKELQEDMAISNCSG